MRNNLIASGAVIGVLLLGCAGAALGLPSIAAAADPSASPVASPSASGAPGADHGHGVMGGTTEAVTDASVVAKAIGITETELNTALSGGQTIAEVAKAHSVDVQTVIDALVADKKDEVAAALKAGTTTQAQADQQLANATQFATDQVNGTGCGPGDRGGRGGPGGHGFGGGPNEAVTDASVAAKAIGISESDLTTALQGGKTVADVAKANNVDVQKVIDALVQDQKDEIAAALKAGTITQAQADQRLANATAFVTAQVNGTGFGPGGDGGDGGHGGHGPMGGPGAGSGAPGASPSAGTGTSG